MAPDAKVRMYLVYLKYYTLNLRPLMVYPKVLLRPIFSIKGISICTNSLSAEVVVGIRVSSRVRLGDNRSMAQDLL